MDRYTKPLQSHVLLVHEHADFLVGRMKSYAKKLDKELPNYSTEDLTLKATYYIRKLKDIQEELACIEDYVLENFPEVETIYEVFKHYELEPEEIN